MKYLLQGRWVQSMVYHPLILYGVAALALELFSAFSARVLRKPLLRPGKESCLVYGGVVLVILNWIIKNGALVLLGVDLLAEPL